MTQVFREDGTVVPVTKIQAGPCVITQVKKKETDGVDSVQVGFGEQKAFRLNKPMKGHLKDLGNVRHMKDFRVASTDLKRGDRFDVSVFSTGDKVQVTGTSKGKGFQGVVKRHNFAGSPASHGHKDQLRMPGSVGATGPARVFKGTRMGGHMGDDQVTVKNLEVMEVSSENNEIFVKGAIPGARGGLLMIASDGIITPNMLIKEEVKEVASEPEVKETVETVEVVEEKKEAVAEEKTSEETNN